MKPLVTTNALERYDFPVCLAPMVGLSNLPLRRLVRTYLPQGVRALWPTEMLNSRRLPHETVGSTLETLRDADEEGLVPQILGNEEGPIAASIEKLVDWGAEGIDINMGCPVSKALRHNYGVSLMGDADYAGRVVQMAYRHSRVPLSVKLRSGAHRDLNYLVRFMQTLVDNGAAWLTLHPRLAGQKRRGRACWDEIAEVRLRLSVPLIGNGDVQNADDALAMLAQTGCDRVMVGRALTARPWLLWQVGERLGCLAPKGREGMRAPQTPEEEGQESARALHFLLRQYRELFPESIGVRRFHFLIRTASPWFVFGQHLWSLVASARTYDDVGLKLDDFFSQPQCLMQETECRS